jgi:hypothetical protein
MFLKEVYRHSKWMFAGMLLFVSGQLVVNYKRGMVFSPFFHYGMYSEKVKPRPDYLVNIVTMNGDTLRGADYTPAQWDKIQYTLHQVIASSCDTLFYQNQIQRLYAKAHLPAPESKIFINKGDQQVRLKTYKIWLAKQLGKEGAQIQVTQNRYVYFFEKFVFQEQIDTLTGTNILCH